MAPKQQSEALIEPLAEGLVHGDENNPGPDFIEPQSKYVTAAVKPSTGGEQVLDTHPEGWLTNHSIAKELERTTSTTQRVANKYAETNPEWFQTYIDSTGRARVFYAPDLIAAIKEEVGAPQQLAEGWEALTRLPQILGKDRSTIQRLANRLVEEHPDWIQTIATKQSGGKPSRHYSAELVEAIKAELLDPAPEGWITIGGLAKVLGKDWGTAKKAVEEEREANPNDFALFAGKGSSVAEYVSPELARRVTEKLDNPVAPEGWFNTSEMVNYLGKSKPTIRAWVDNYREEHPEWFQSFGSKIKSGKSAEYYSPELIAILTERLGSQKRAPNGWKTPGEISKDAQKNTGHLVRAAEKFRATNPEWFGIFTVKSGQLQEHFAPELAQLIAEEAEEQANIPEGWVQRAELVRELGTSTSTIGDKANNYRKEHPEWFAGFLNYPSGKGSRLLEFYHPELVDILRDEFGIPAPEGWATIASLKHELGRTWGTINNLVEQYREEHPEWFNQYRDMGGAKKQTTFIHPELAEIVRGHFSKYESAPEGWMPNRTLAKRLRVAQDTVERLALPYIETNPDWFKRYLAQNNQMSLHYSPEVVGIIEEAIIGNRHDLALGEHFARNKNQLEDELTQFVDEISEGEGLESQEFRQLIQLFGSERALDILFQYRPDYRKLDLPYVRRIIGDYLGDFLTIRNYLQLDVLEDNLEYLADPSLKEGLTEIIKNDCLRFYNERHKIDPDRNDEDILALYFDNLRSQTADYQTTELAEVIDEVAKYYRSLFEDFQKPDCLVNELKDGRRFPDLNQRINIKEIELKHKMLLADEMGVGKSASAILAKESMGVKQALIIVPSNVVEVWLRYLSDGVDDNGDAAGYFKRGQAPNVLVVNSLKELSIVNPNDYDYVILSHERLTEEYSEALEKFDYGMLIVDEVHKLKNITEGVWADNLIKLAGRIEEGAENKYLALLSGTPIPNKVGDIAMILRLLYPEKFEHINNNELTRQILMGDVLNLRSLLVPRMQMKSLAESIEMPNLHEELHVVGLSKEERDHYEVLLEEDELTASQKLQILRQFVLNPEVFEAVPDLESSKIREVGAALRQTFSTKDKVVMFVNGYIEGVIRGDKTIFNGLGLPGDIEVEIIDGQVSKTKRLELQSRLQHSNGKLLLAVSGQTADVGVDFSGADELYFYNEPWTEYDKKQQQGRVYRPGLHQDLVSHTFYVKDTVEEGIHRYIEFKYNAVEKLLRGIPLSELERQLLAEDEKQADPNLEVNPALAEHYLSSWDRMLKIYNHVKEIGEQDFVKFLSRYGREYAECYTDLGSRSYQANAGRLSGTVIDRIVKSKKQDPGFVRILDVASGPEMLKRHIGESYQDQVVSVDINPHHFEELDDKRRVGSFLDLPVADSSVDYANLSLALHYSKFVPTRGNYERVEVLKELNRALVNGGVAVINTMHTLDLKYPEVFEKAVEKIGFKVVEQYTGEVSSANNFRTRLIVLQKFSDCPNDTQALVRSMGGHIIGFKFKKTGVKLRDSRRIVTSFILRGNKNLNARFNQYDQAILDEEQRVLKQMNRLKRAYGSIRFIPREQIFGSGLARAFTGKTYVLFKSLESGNGAVITR